MEADFEIPAIAKGLRKVDISRLDLRSNPEIIAELKTFRPVTSEKNVWAFWDKGIDAMYPAYKMTVINWVRKLGRSWTVRVVDLGDDDSPNAVNHFVSKDWFPVCFNDRTMTGSHAAQHAADLLRLPLLYEHGGVWMDVGNMLHTHLDDLFWDHIGENNINTDQYEMGLWIITGQIRKQWGSFGNYMLAARKRCIFIRNWHLSWKECWKGKTSVEGFHELPLLKDIGLADGMADWGFGDKLKHMSDYVAHMLLGERTRNLLVLEGETQWDGRAFFENKSWMVEGIYNGILGAIDTEYDGTRQMELFTTPLDEPDEEKRAKAELFVVKMLEQSHMYKVYHNSAGIGPPALGDLVKRKEYFDAVDRPGTFGELYRHGTVHWESTREVEQLHPEATHEEYIRATPTTPSAKSLSTANEGSSVEG